MSRNKIIFALSIPALLCQPEISADVTSTLTSGWLERATAMENIANYAGSSDQSRRFFNTRILNPDENAEGLYILAISTLRSGDINTGEKLLNDFLEEFPASPRRWKAITGLAAASLSRGQTASALVLYNSIPTDAFTGEEARELTFNRAYCLLLLGDYDHAGELFSSIGDDGSIGNDARFYLGYIAYIKGNHSRALDLFGRVDTSRAPGNTVPFYTMEIDFSRGNYSTALASARNLLASGNTPTGFIPECNRIAGESLYNLEQETESIPFLWKYAAEVDNPAPSAFYILGVNEYNNGDNDAAIKLLQKAVTTDNAMAQSAYLILGQAYQRRGDYDQALMAFEQAYRMNYDRNVRETAFYNYAVARVDGGRVPFGSSVGLLEDFLSEFPNSRYSTRVRQYMVEGYMSQNDYEAALKALDGVRQTTPELRAARQRVLFVLGTREYVAGHTSTAHRYLSEVIEISGAEGTSPALTTQARLWLGKCLYKGGDYDGAARLYRSFLRETPESDTYNRALTQYDLGYARFAAGAYGDALTDFTRAIDSGRDGVFETHVLADAYNRAGDCRYYLKDFDKAYSLYSQAYNLHPASGDYAMFQMAIVKGLTGNHSDKISRLDNLIAEFPATGLVPSALLEKAESQLAIGKRREAITTYRELVDKYSSTAPGRNGYLQLALTYLNGNERTAAIDTYKEVITRYPSSDEARMAADDLKRIYAAEGKLEAYASFINAIPDAPRIDSGEMDNAAFEAAENLYATRSETRLLETYLEKYPRGANAPRALYYLAENAWNKGNASRAAALAATLVETYPHAEAAEQALLLKADAEMAQGKYEPALASLRDLETRASSANMLHETRLGIMRATDALGRYRETLATADALLASTAVNSGDTPSEIAFMRAKALDNLGKKAEARSIWKSLANYPDNLYGSMSAVYLAKSLFDSGDTASAKSTVDALIDANPPHSYWLARGFILYSDILNAQGNKFEAREYLKSLRNNYPGKDADIFDMINQRLNK